MKPSLFYPIKPIHVNQGFGENQNAFYAQQGLKGHAGIDFRAAHGQPIYAAHDGTCYPRIDNHGGNGVRLETGLGTGGYATIYWHLIQDDAVVHTGTVVKAGDLLGYADNTGESTGDHLHFGLMLNETPWTNGYAGYTDPQPYFNGKYAEDINNPPPPPSKFQFTKLLRCGSWNLDVRELQTILTSQNLYTGVIDGHYGKITLGAVKAFQTQHGLISDGIVGPLTRAELNKYVS